MAMAIESKMNKKDWRKQLEKKCDEDMYDPDFVTWEELETDLQEMKRKWAETSEITKLKEETLKATRTSEFFDDNKSIKEDYLLEL